MKAGEFKGLPIFSTGRWHGKDYDESDLDTMVDSFKATQGDFVRPLGLTHDDPEENKFRAALGGFATIYRAGKQILADIKDVPAKLNQAMKDGRLLSGSVTLYPEYNGHKNVIRSFDLLGRDIPEVKGMGDLRSYVFVDNEPETVTIEFKATSQGDSSNQNADGKPAGENKPKILTKGFGMEPIKFTDESGQVLEFADNSALQKYISGQVDAGKTGLVSASELQTFKEKAEKFEKMTLATAAEKHALEIKTTFAEFRKPVNGKLIPPAVIDGAEKLAIAFPSGDSTIKFSDGDKEISALDKLTQILKSFHETGLVNFEETGENPQGNPAGSVLKTDFSEAKKNGHIRSDMTFEEYQQAQE